MPRYEYLCESCGNTFEVTQRMSDDPLTNCTCCEAGSVKRLISPGNGLIFKGSGFYITDYKNGGGSTATSSSTTSESSKAESKPAAAPAGGTCGAGGCPNC